MAGARKSVPEWGVMVNEPQISQIKLRVHGARDTNNRVRAEVFARQLTALIKALEAADKIANGGVRFDYVIAELKNESASVTLTEVVSSKKSRAESGIKVLGDTIEGIIKFNPRAIHKHSQCLPHIVSIAQGVSNDFFYSDINIGDDISFRVDDLFLEQVLRAREFVTMRMERLYTGVAIGTFDGTIKEVDLRGDAPRLKLILRAGGKEIDCVYSGATSEQIREILDRRVSVEGRAHYSGKSGLPERIEILKHQEIKPSPDILRWQKQFDGLTASDWDISA